MGCYQGKKKEIVEIKSVPLSRSHKNTSEILRPQKSGAIKIHTKNIVLEKKAKVTDDYKILDKLGSGAFGSVYKVLCNKSKRLRAMKIIKKENIKYQDDEQLFLKEIEILKSIDHPNILKIFEYYIDQQNFYVITEFVNGGELYDSIAKWKEFNEPKAAFIMSQIMSAVFYLHSKSIVHRDIKPENVMIESKKNSPSDKLNVKLIDFGTCNFLEEDDYLTLKVGTPYYIAPEVLDKKYNHQCDVWSAGVTLYILLCGFPPFYGNSTTEIFQQIKRSPVSFQFKEFAKISSQAKDLLRKMLDKMPNRRITAEEVMQHPWFKMNSEEEKLDDNILQNVIVNIKNFNAKEKLQQTAIAYIVHLLQNSKEIEELKKIFKTIDKNGDGMLNYDELKEGFRRVFGENFTHVEFDRIVKDLDQDEDGFIGYEEFLRATLDKNLILTKENLKIAFEHFDANKDGTLCMNEIKNILGTDENNLVEEAFKAVDEDSDGNISYDEFCQLMNKIVLKAGEDKSGTIIKQIRRNHLSTKNVLELKTLD